MQRASQATEDFLMAAGSKSWPTRESEENSARSQARQKASRSTYSPIFLITGSAMLSCEMHVPFLPWLPHRHAGTLSNSKRSSSNFFGSLRGPFCEA